jgi:phosphatidylglycerophosphate synthase
MADRRLPIVERTPNGSPPCIVDLRATGWRWPEVRARFRDSAAQARASLAATPELRRSYGRWSGLGVLLLHLSALGLGLGADGPATLAVAVALLSAWGLFWWWIIRVHLSLVRTPEGATRPSFGLPNGLTFLRILLVPAAGWMILAHGRLQAQALLCAVTFFLLGFSDVLDGLLARWLHLGSPLGRYLDHLADVLILTAVAVAEWAAGLLPGWLMGLVLLRYVGTGAGGIIALATVPRTRIAPTVVGKLTTLVVGMTVYLAVARALVLPGIGPAMPYLHWASGGIIALNVVVLIVNLARAGAPGPPATGQASLNST